MATLINLQDHNNHFLMREIVIDTETTGFDPLGGGRNEGAGAR
jgi:DNA polymerase III epsilon subunit-like protein